MWCKLRPLILPPVCYQNSMAHCESVVHMKCAQCVKMLKNQFKILLKWQTRLLSPAMWKNTTMLNDLDVITERKNSGFLQDLHAFSKGIWPCWALIFGPVKDLQRALMQLLNPPTVAASCSGTASNQTMPHHSLWILHIIGPRICSKYVEHGETMPLLNLQLPNCAVAQFLTRPCQTTPYKSSIIIVPRTCSKYVESLCCVTYHRATASV